LIFSFLFFLVANPRSPDYLLGIEKAIDFYDFIF